MVSEMERRDESMDRRDGTEERLESGKVIYIVGMGPGNPEGMTKEAETALRRAELIIGYARYVELLKPFFPGKEFLTTGMKQELERCRLCYEEAQKGKRTALVCSGDAGVYGMASPMYELQKDYPDVDLVVIPGVTAANSGAALLGAPLGHDFCVISLSDLLTPWEMIERRLRAAVEGDFAIALYNPASHRRKDYLARAVRIMMETGAAPERACGYVENIGREGTRAVTCTLSELASAEVNMFTTVFIGNSQSEIRNGKLITKRGYQI